MLVAVIVMHRAQPHGTHVVQEGLQMDWACNMLDMLGSWQWGTHAATLLAMLT